jgi:glycosyltransferase involved in cell wall biosynthesis
LYAARLGRALRKPVILRMTRLSYDDPASIRTGRWPVGVFRDACFRQASAVVTISPALTEAYRATGMDMAKLHAIPPAVNTERFAPASEADKQRLRNTLGLDPLATCVLFAGGINERKGADLLFEAFCPLAVSRADVSLIMVGHHATRDANRIKQQIESKAAAHQISGRVLFTGVIDHVEQYMKACDLFVFPSANEGFGTVVPEAMSCGLPVILTRIPGISDYIVADGRDGIILPSRDRNSLMAAIRALVDQPQERKRLSQRAREKVVNKFSTHRITEKYLELYDKLLMPSECRGS